MAKTPPWHEVSVEHGLDENGISAVVVAKTGSPWFDGHFPGQPILPGIALLAMAFEAAQEQEAREGNRIRLKAVKRVRFKKPVRPDEPFTVAVKREQKESGISYSFTILLGGEAGCTGILAVETIS